MEQLRTYLTGRKKADFALLIGTTPSYLSQLLAGSKRPSYRMMVAIRDATEGAVSLESWTEGASQ